MNEWNEIRMIFESVRKYSHFLRLCWLGALLHDLGKLDLHFILSKEPGSSLADHHGQIIFADRAIVPGTLLKILASPFEKLCAVPPGFEGFSLLSFICSHHGCKRCLGEQYCGSQQLHRHRLALLLQAADRIDTSNPADKNKQYLLDIKGSNFWGEEFDLFPEHFSGFRSKIYQGMDRIFKKRSLDDVQKIALIERLLGTYLSRGLSETRKWAHDVDIFSHARSVAVHLRMLLIEELEGKSLNSEIEAHFRCLRIKAPCKEMREIIQDRFCIGASIYGNFCETLFFVGPQFTCDMLSEIIKVPFRLSEVMSAGNSLEAVGENFYLASTDGDHNLEIDIKQCFRHIEGFNVLEPEEIAPGYTMEKLIDGIRMVLDYSLYCDLLNLRENKRSLLVHHANVKKALRLTRDDKAAEVYDDVIRRLGELEGRIGALTPIGEIERRWGWSSKCSAARDVWEFLSLALSPIRPPSPQALSKRWRSIIGNDRLGEAHAKTLILRKQPNLTRFFVLMRDVRKMFKCMSRGKKVVKSDTGIRFDEDVPLNMLASCGFSHLEKFFAGSLKKS